MPWSFKPMAHAQKVFQTVALWTNCTDEPYPPKPLKSKCNYNWTTDTGIVSLAPK